MNKKLVEECFKMMDDVLKMSISMMDPEYLDGETIQQIGNLIDLYNKLRVGSIEWAESTDHYNKVLHDLLHTQCDMLNDQSKRLKAIEAKLDKMADKAE